MQSIELCVVTQKTCKGNFPQNVFNGSLMIVDQDFPTYYRMDDDEHRIVRSGCFSNSQIHPQSEVTHKYQSAAQIYKDWVGWESLDL